MKLLLILALVVPSIALASEGVDWQPQIQKTKSNINPELEKDEAIYVFHFKGDSPVIPEANVYYSIDGVQGRQLSKNNTITLASKAGKHIFQFYYNNQYAEVYSDSLLIEANYEDKYSVNLESVSQPRVVSKPVIYLYPEKTTEVSVQIDIHGEHPFYYPAYADSWDFTATPDGELRFDDNAYNYLFWEAQTRTILTPQQTASGFFVKGEDAVSFLEDKLNLAGLNSKEQGDFITFWGPRLAQNTLNFVHFEFNEDCQQYADLEISPKPDNLYRIFMIWGAVTEEFQITKQTIEQFDRTGFSVLEWGGKESHIKQHFSNKSTQ